MRKTFAREIIISLKKRKYSIENLTKKEA